MRTAASRTVPPPAGILPAPALVAASGLCGLAWGQPSGVALLGLAALVPLLWSLAGSRWSAAAVVLAFQLAASRGMPSSTGIFFAETAPAWFGWVLWAGMAGANALPWCVLWRREARSRAIGLVLALVLITLPPLGVIGWANPVTAAGVLFPGTGFAGLGLLCAVWVVFALGRFRAVASLAVIAAAANAVAVFQPAPAVHNWRGQDTAYGRLGTGPDAALAAYGRLLDLQDLAAALPPATVMVLPETLVGRYTSATTRVLDSTVAELRAKRSVVLVGAELADADGRLDNVLLALGTPDVIRQRIPIPVGMWRPWAADSYSMHLDGRGVALVAGRRIAPLICYEQLLVLPVLVSMANGADTLVGAANDWWARGTSAPVIQQQAMSAWGRLFGVPVVRATNL